jgi:hypothetical protein
MYNLLFTAKEGSWDLYSYEFDRERFLEYTVESLRRRFAYLDSKAIEELKSFPTLFTYEGIDKTVRVGYIRQIKDRTRHTLLIEFEFDDGIKSFSYSALKPYESNLDIGWLEMSRTHWAVKDEDLFEILSSFNLVDPSYKEEGHPVGSVGEMLFKVSLSFPGEKRAYVSEVASELKKRLGKGAVFYDEDFRAPLARPNLDTLLQRIYLINSALVVVFLCAEYEQKNGVV